MKSRAQEEESWRKSMLGESVTLLLQLDCSHSSTFRCGALLMYETDEHVQQQQFTQRDLIAPRSAELQDDGKHSCSKGKFSSSDLCTCYGDCKSRSVCRNVTDCCV